MSLEQFLLEKRSSLMNQWRDIAIGSYPIDAQRFFNKEKNRFSNPVGQTINENMEALFDELISGGEPQKISSRLDPIIRIRAVQDFKPSQAVGFILPLRKLIREEIRKNDSAGMFSDEMDALEARIENAVFLAFDIYTQCRQKIFDIRVNETRNQLGRLLERANLTIEIPEQDNQQ